MDDEASISSSDRDERLKSFEAAFRHMHGDAVRRTGEVQPLVDARIRASIDSVFAARSVRIDVASGDAAAQWHRFRPRRPMVQWSRRIALVAAMFLVAAASWFAIAPSGPATPERQRPLADAVRAAERLGAASDSGSSSGTHPLVQAILASIVAMPGVDPVAPAASGRFIVYDLFIDPSQPLAGWTCEFEAPGQLAGIEGGEGAFASPATYDPSALAGDRVILASVADGVAPATRVRVASITVRVGGGGEPRVGRLVIVGPEGAPATGSIDIVQRGSPLASLHSITQDIP